MPSMKYGASTGGCLPLLIQMPILFALFRVINNIPAYITNVKGYVYRPCDICIECCRF